MFEGYDLRSIEFPKDDFNSLHARMYLRLFNAVSDAINELDLQNFSTAKEVLVAAQIECEQMYIEAED